jgi:hypothetical protein
MPAGRVQRAAAKVALLQQQELLAAANLRCKQRSQRQRPHRARLPWALCLSLSSHQQLP